MARNLGVTDNGHSAGGTTDSRNAVDAHMGVSFAAARRTKIEAWKYGKTCGRCGAPLGPSDTLHRYRMGYDTFLTCESCGPAYLKGRTPRRCKGCGRGLVQPAYALGHAPVCCEACRDAWHNRKRRERRAAKRVRECAACGETFAPSRSDGRYCSGACRQRAYRDRQRKAPPEGEGGAGSVA